MLSIQDYLKYPNLKVFTPGCGIELSERVTLGEALKLDAKELAWSDLRHSQMVCLKRQLEEMFSAKNEKRIKVDS